MNFLHAIILGIVEGVTEFLPISSTGHLTITEKLLGLDISHPGVVAFTAVIQIGAIAAAVLYFWPDIWRILCAWWRGLWWRRARRNPDYAYGWAIIIGSVPIALIGLLLKHHVETTFRGLWWVAAGLLVWSGVMWLADRWATRRANGRSERQATWHDLLVMGLVQCIALVPGISRSGATISAGLFRGFDRLSVVKLSFFLGIPALVASGLQQAISHVAQIGQAPGWGMTLVATAVSFVVGYLVVSWLIKFITRHDFAYFIWYRVGLALLLMYLLINHTISAI